MIWAELNTDGRSTAIKTNSIAAVTVTPEGTYSYPQVPPMLKSANAALNSPNLIGMFLVEALYKAKVDILECEIKIW